MPVTFAIRGSESPLAPSTAKAQPPVLARKVVSR
jgi:hypothetical protein